ncbi:MAG: penicillin-binding transpeptidase domain-containing protein [Acidobacteriota bacterium]
MQVKLRSSQTIWVRFVIFTCAALLLAIPSLPVADAAQAKTSKKSAKGPAPKSAPKSVASTGKKKSTRRTVSSPWKAPNFADSSSEDFTDGDDPDARLAAVAALGKFNGSVVVTDAETGRILTVVGQKTAFKSGFQPCSTIKVPVALAALSESVVDRLTQIRIYGNTKVALTEALARSNNNYFASLGEKLGFERMSYYARLYGLGEKASLNIEDEQPGILPSRTPVSGMGMMTSFGDGITLTPLEYASLIGAVANGGTLYYLQYPKNQEEAGGFIPQVKRKLDIEHIIDDLKPGMMGAVEYGTARRVGFNAEAPVYGKTGTCTDTRTPTHLGWFGSFTEVGHDKLVVVVMLTGGSAVSGGSAAGVGGQVYKNLINGNFYAHTQDGERLSPAVAQGSSVKDAGQ